MADKTSKTKLKRLSKSQRAHVRRLKQAARKTGTAHSYPTSASRPSRAPKKEDEHNEDNPVPQTPHIEKGLTGS